MIKKTIFIILLFSTVSVLAENGSDSVLVTDPDENELISSDDPSASSAAFQLYIRLFQIFISPVDGRQCIFRPTCSQYARDAIKKYGFIKAYPLIMARLIRCNPTAYTHNTYERNEEGIPYDPVK